MAKSYIGVKKNIAGNGWDYSVKKPGNIRVSYYRKGIKTALKAAVIRESEIIRENYDQELPANERNFTDEELNTVKAETTGGIGPFKKKKAVTEAKPEVVETEVVETKEKPKKDKKDKGKKKKKGKKKVKKGKDKKKKSKK